MYNRKLYETIFSGSSPYNLQAALKPCEVCAQEQQVPYLYRISCITGELRSHSFVDVLPAHDKRIVTALKQSITRGGFVSLVGNPGVGKTYLLAATINWAIENNWRRSVYSTTAMLLDHLKRTMRNRDSYISDDFWPNVEKCDLLAIDEFDEYSGTAWADEQLHRLVDDRYNRWRTCTTLLGIKDFDKITPSIKSRLLDRHFTVFLMQTEDLRQVSTEGMSP